LTGDGKLSFEPVATMGQQPMGLTAGILLVALIIPAAALFFLFFLHLFSCLLHSVARSFAAAALVHRA
jgi:hypothetical protein